MNEYVVKHFGADTHIVPSAHFAIKYYALLLLIAVATMLFGFGIYFAEKAGFGIAFSEDNAPNFQLFLFVSCVVIFIIYACIGSWMWIIRNRPLVINAKTKEVHYGNRPLCSGATVKAIYLHTDVDHKCTLSFAFSNNQVVQIPSPWFAFMTEDTLTKLAEEMSALLNVKVSEPPS